MGPKMFWTPILLYIRYFLSKNICFGHKKFWLNFWHFGKKIWARKNFSSKIFGHWHHLNTHLCLYLHLNITKLFIVFTYGPNLTTQTIVFWFSIVIITATQAEERLDFFFVDFYTNYWPMTMNYTFKVVALLKKLTHSKNDQSG